MQPARSIQLTIFSFYCLIYCEQLALTTQQNAKILILNY